MIPSYINVSRSNKHFAYISSKYSIFRSSQVEYSNFLQTSETIGKISLKDIKHIILVFDKRFSANPPELWSVLLDSAKFSEVKIISENNSQILLDAASEVTQR